MRTIAWGLLWIMACCADVPWASAQQVPIEPASTHIFPAGGRRGSTIPVRIGTECLPPHTQLLLDGNGLSAPPLVHEPAVVHHPPSLRRRPQEIQVTYPREWQTQISIAADAPLGASHWRLSCAQGGVSARPFLIGDLPEWIEQEPNSRPELAETLTLPVTLNGQIAGERDQDYFRFTAIAGQAIHLDVMAARLGSPLETVIEIIDQNGKRMKLHEARIGCDPMLAFVPPHAGEFLLAIANLTYRGAPDHVYRITITDQPLVATTFPAGGQAGTSPSLEIFTLGQATDVPPAFAAVAIPADARGGIQLTSTGHPGLITLEAGVHPELLEQEPNDLATTATEITVPMTANGRLIAADDQDYYAFQAQAGQFLAFDCHAAPRGLATLPELQITDEAGTPLAQVSAITDPDRVARLEWRAPAAGRFIARVRDVQYQSRGGPELIYRLTVAEAVQDFALHLPVDFVNCPQEGRVEVDLLVDRRGGFAEPIDLEISGLPVGVTVAPLQVPPGVPSIKLAFTADSSAASAASQLRITGRAAINGQMVHRVARANHAGRDADGVAVGPVALEHLLLTVKHKPMFKLYCNEAYQYAHRGTIYPYLMEVERLNGFTGPIALEVADRQNKDLDGIEVRNLTVAPEHNQVMLPLYLPETMHINVQAHSNVYAQGCIRFTDAHGAEQSQLVVSTMRCMIRTLPPVAKLRAATSAAVVADDGSVVCRLELERSLNFQGDMLVELVGCETAGLAVEATPATIAADQSEVELRVRAVNGSFPLGTLLRFRGSGELGDGAQVISEASIRVQ